jgi:hypothetical protein
MWKNKHVVVGMLVAPILAVIAWFAVDYFVAERPHAAVPGADYKLVAKSNCRYASGSCDLSNSEFELTINAAESGTDLVRLTVVSKFPLQLANIAVAEHSDAMTAPEPLTAEDSSGTLWSGTIVKPEYDGATLQFAVVANKSRYYAELPTVFLTTEARKTR